MAANPERKAVDQADLVARIEALPACQHQRLLAAAKSLSGGLRIAPEDLLQRAFLSVLEGRRKCPEEVNIMTFLYGVMRSLATSERNSSYRHPEEELDENEDPSSSDATCDTDELDPETLVMEEEAAEQLMSRLEEHFGDDEEVLLLIMSRANGDSPAESKALLGKSDQDYATICKRLRRGYLKLIRKEES